MGTCSYFQDPDQSLEGSTSERRACGDARRSPQSCSLHNCPAVRSLTWSPTHLGCLYSSLRNFLLPILCPLHQAVSQPFTWNPPLLPPPVCERGVFHCPLALPTLLGTRQVSVLLYAEQCDKKGSSGWMCKLGGDQKVHVGTTTWRGALGRNLEGAVCGEGREKGIHTTLK